MSMSVSLSPGCEGVTECVVVHVPKVIDFPRYNTKCSGKNEILRGIFHVVFRFPLHFVLNISRKFGLLFGQRMVSVRESVSRV